MNNKMLSFLDDDTYKEFKAANGDITKLSDKAYETVKAASKVASDMNTPKQKMEVSPVVSGLQGVAESMSLGLDDEIGGFVTAAGKGLVPGGEGFDYEKERDRIRASKRDLQEANPNSYLAGNLVGAVASPGISSVKGAAALGAVAGFGSSDEEDALGIAQDTLTGGVIGGVAQKALPAAMNLAGKGIKGGAKLASKVIPGSEGALPIVNQTVAKLGSLVPGTDIDAHQLNELLSDTTSRRAARALKEPGKLDRIGQGTSDLFNEVADLSENQMSTAYNKGKRELFEKMTDADAAKFDFAEINRIKGAVDQRPELFGRAGKVLNQVDGILTKGGVDEIGKKTQDMPFDFLTKNFKLSDAASIQANRLLEGRKFIDDVTKNVDYEKMLKSEKDMIVKTRQAINKQIDKLTGSKSLRNADAVFSEYAPAKKDAFFKLETPLPSGGREINADTAVAFLKSDKAQSRFIESKLADLGEIMTKLDVPGNNAIKDLNETVISTVKENFKVLSKLEDLKRASGGPSSQAINTLMQLGGVYSTGGLSLLAIPITNPAAWMKLVDGADQSLKPFLMKISDAARKVAKERPQLAARLYVVGKQQAEKDKD